VNTARWRRHHPPASKHWLSPSPKTSEDIDDPEKGTSWASTSTIPPTTKHVDETAIDRQMMTNDHDDQTRASAN
jgi:hypothetical protein